MADKVLATLKKAAQGILYPSETDAPFEPFVWEKAENNLASVKKLASLSAKAKGKQVSLEEFFGELAEEEDFQRLRAALEAAVKDIKVYRFGAANVNYFLVGTAPDGRLAGLKAEAVET